MLAITYSDLKQQIAYNVATSDRHRENLRSLKEYFKKDINSPRQYEKINTISELLRVLETRDVLSEIDVRPLKEIAFYIKMPRSSELLDTIVRYERTPKQRDLPNDVVPEISDQKILSNEKLPLVAFIDGISSSKKHRIFVTVIERIGPFWCILARKLKIREIAINEINKKYDNLYTKATKMMELYEMRADPQNWFIILCHALDEAKMVRLRKEIQQIMMMNIS